jgi:FkbM family methyltransferase
MSLLRSASHVVSRAAARITLHASRGAAFVGRGGAPAIDAFAVALRLLEAARGGDVSFVQIGAHDGKTFDALWPFASAGSWSGVLVEPQEGVFRRLVANYSAARDTSRLRFENAAIARRDGEAVLYQFAADANLPAHATMLASFNRDALRFNGHGYWAPVVSRTVPALSVATLLRKHELGRVDVLQVDAEGFDAEVVAMFVEAGVLPAVVRYEHGALSIAERRRCVALLGRHGYRFAFQDIDAVALRLPSGS